MVTDVHLLLLLSLLLFNQLYYLTHQDDNKLHCIKTAAPCIWQSESFHSYLSKYFYRPHPNISLFIIKLKEYRNIIYVKLQGVNFPATVTNKRSHVAKRLADDLIVRYERVEISGLEYVSEVSYRYRKEWYVRNIPSKLGACEAAQ